MSITSIIILIIVILIVWAVLIYNGLIRRVNQVKNAWADIDVQLKRRYDLIPNLINTVKGAANFESSTLENVVKARNIAMTAHDSGDKNKMAESENMLTGALKSIFALSENYPNLTATANYKELQMELSDTENKIQSARRFYNSNVQDLNTAIQVFPSNIIAKIFNFKESELWELAESEAEAKNVVKVEF